MSIIYSLVNAVEDSYITVFAPGRDPLPVGSSHPNFEAIVGACEASRRGEDVSVDEVCELIDVAATVSRKFARLSERITVSAGGVMLDGDPVHGTLQAQILDFLDAGEDFSPLVNFYEKLTTNPLGDVREGLYDWIKGQTANGDKLSITPEGNILGYKSVCPATPRWRTEHETVYIPSRPGAGIVNGVDVSADQYIEQVPGDVVEMPRSKVLHAPSVACGDGLHIGTYGYALDFYGGNTVMLVEFSPRDIVSLPDHSSTWKLRVCRYTVIGPVDEPLEVPVYLTSAPAPVEDDADLVFEAGDEFVRGDRFRDQDGDEGVVINGNPDEHGEIEVEFDDSDLGAWSRVDASTTVNLTRAHGKGGPTSQAAKGRGRNPAQDDKGRFTAGRPNSARDASTGRFA